jgi:opacity protein-like surface antigen
MKRLAGWVVMAIVPATLSRPASAQLNTLPVYYSPQARPGFTISGDFSRGLNNDSRKNTALGVRTSLGLSVFEVGVGLGTVNPHVTPSQRGDNLQFMSYAAVRLVGGSLLPVAVSVQGGIGHLSYEFTTSSGAVQDVTAVNIPFGVGIALNVRTPGFSVEPWVAPRYSIHRLRLDGDSNSQSGFGVSAGVNLQSARGVGVHAAIDWVRLAEDRSGAPDLARVNPVTFGLGLHYRIRLPGSPGVSAL